MQTIPELLCWHWCPDFESGFRRFDSYLRSMFTDDKFYWYRAELIAVTDGDTIKVRVDMGMKVYRDVVLRFEGINAPEKHGDTKELGLASKDACAAWLVGREIVVRTYKDPGSYDRYTAEVYDGKTSESLTKYMLDSGFAAPYVYKWS